MKLTKTQIVLGSLGVAAVGATLFFTLTKKGKELRGKWFGKKETIEPEGKPAEDTKTDTAKTDIPPKNTGIAGVKPKMTLIEANALAGLIQVTEGRKTAEAGAELNKKINETKDKLEKAGYKMVQVKNGKYSFTFKAELI